VGLVTRRVLVGGLDHGVHEIAERIASRSAPVVRLTKKAVRAGRDLPFLEALAETERIYKEELLPLEDVAEGAAAFLEKRKAEWKHR
jgi:enoyl-CoA hydratase/carnithine racemase